MNFDRILEGSTNMTAGLDVSHWQDDYNYIESFIPAKTAGYKFVMIKASEGLSVDHSLEMFAKLAIEAKMLVGFYHYFRNNIGVGETQANTFTKAVLPYGEKIGKYRLPDYIDVERYYNTRNKQNYNTAHIKTWLDTVSTGNKTGIYTSKTMWQEMTNQPEWLKDYNSWIADWTKVSWDKGAPQYVPPNYSSKFPFVWQLGPTEHPQIPWLPKDIPGFGPKTEVDINVMAGKYEDILKKIGTIDDESPPEDPEANSKLIQIKIGDEMWDGWVEQTR